MFAVNFQIYLYLDEIIDKMEKSNDFSQSYDDETSSNTDWKPWLLSNIER